MTFLRVVGELYTPVSSSPRRGVNHRFVNVGDGSAAFSRIDMMVSAPMSIVVRRMFDSNRENSTEFGRAGWHLVATETILLEETIFTYTPGNGRGFKFGSNGRIINALDAYASDVTSIQIMEGKSITFRLRDGKQKVFRPSSSDINSYLLDSVQDVHGNNQGYIYDAQDNLRRIESGESNWVEFERNSNQLISSILDSNNRSVVYAYDSQNQLSDFKDLRGHTWEYDYINGKLVESVAPTGRDELSFSYFDDGKVQHSVVNGISVTYEYTGNVTKVLEEIAGLFKFEQNADGLTVKVENPIGVTTEIKTTAAGLPYQLLRNEMIQSKVRYGQSNQLESISIFRSELGEPLKDRIEFDSVGRVIKRVSKNPAQNYVVSDYVGMNPARIDYGNQTSTIIILDQFGQVKEYVGQDELKTTIARTGNQWVVKIANQQPLTLNFDDLGQVVDIAGDEDTLLTFSYDDAGFREYSVDSNGGKATYNYDSSGTMFSSETGYGLEMESFDYVFGANQQVDRISQSDGSNHEVEYNANGLITSFETPLIDGALEFSYDDFNRLNGISRPGKGTAWYEYSDGEADLVVQFDKRAVSVDQHRVQSDFRDRFSMRYQRSRAPAYGVVH